jgi:ubiquitin conjugation factor E4 B
LALDTDCQDYRSEWSPQSSLASYLLIDPEDDRGIDFEFINEAVRRFDEDDSVKPAFISAVEQLSAQLSSMNVNDDYKSYAIVS